MFEFLQGWIIYPFSELSHASQGILVGVLGARSILHKEVSDVLCALLITIAFATYEITEKWQINDNASADFENFWVSAMATGLIYTGVHFTNKWRKERSIGK